MIIRWEASESRLLSLPKLVSMAELLFFFFLTIILLLVLYRWWYFFFQVFSWRLLMNDVDDSSEHYLLTYLFHCCQVKAGCSWAWLWEQVFVYAILRTQNCCWGKVPRSRKAVRERLEKKTNTWNCQVRQRHWSLLCFSSLWCFSGVVTQKYPFMFM